MVIFFLNIRQENCFAAAIAWGVDCREGKKAKALKVAVFLSDTVGKVRHGLAPVTGRAKLKDSLEHSRSGDSVKHSS